MHVDQHDADDLTTISAVELARRIAAGETSAVEALEAYIRRIDALNPELNAVVVPLFDSALASAKRVDELCRRGEPLSPLSGVPMTIKESFDLVDTPTTIGISRNRRTPAESEGPIVQRLRRSGAVFVGKTNVPLIMLAFETDNRCYGRTPQPEDLSRASGGSSGGEACAVAARFSAVGLGSDLLGSIRQPAHACGVHGFKPTMGRCAMLGSMNTLRGMDAIAAQAGPIARHMDDIVAVARIMLEEPYEDPFAQPMPWRDPATVDVGKLRIGIWDDDPMFSPAPAVQRVVREAADALRAAGAEIVPFAPSNTEEVYRICLGLLAAAAGQNARRLLGGERPTPAVARMLRIWGMSSNVRAAFCRTFDALGQPWRAKLVRWSRNCSTADYWELVHARKEYVRAAMADWRKAGIDALICPPHGLPALRHGTSSDTITAGVYAFATSLLGVPCGTVAASRVGADEETNRRPSREHMAKSARTVELGSAGLPVGVQVASWLGRDEVCLAVMQALEKYFATKDDFPPRSLRGVAGRPVAQTGRE